MRFRNIPFLLFGIWLVPLANFALAEPGTTIFRRSYFTHDPASGERVNQFARGVPAFRPTQPFTRSGYRHLRSGIRVGRGSDDLNIVETWGGGESIRPYGEWLRPYRRGSVPYSLSDPPFGYGQGYGFGSPYGYPGHGDGHRRPHHGHHSRGSHTGADERNPKSE